MNTFRPLPRCPVCGKTYGLEECRMSATWSTRPTATLERWLASWTAFRMNNSYEAGVAGLVVHHLVTEIERRKEHPEVWHLSKDHGWSS